MGNTSINLLVKMILTAWQSHNNQLKKIIDTYSDEQLQREIAPGKNTGVYLLGHMVAVHDAMLPLLGLGEKLYPEMEEPFIKMPDKSGQTMPSISELKQRLHIITQHLDEKFAGLTAGEWLSRHLSVSPEDFEKEPHRNKLNVIISRTNHLANHIGQLLLLK